MSASLALVVPPESDAIPALRTLSIEELAAAVEHEHQQIGASVAASIEHAIRAGLLLLEAKSRLPFGDWQDWLALNTPGVTMEYARIYMRVARNRELVREQMPPSLKAARKMLVKANVRDLRYDPELRTEARRLRKDGLSHKKIATELGCSTATVSRWLNPAAERRYRESRAKTSRTGRLALNQTKRVAAANKVGGDVAEGYALIRRSLDALERASTECSGEARTALRSAMNSLYNAEDAVSRAVKVWEIAS